MRVLIALTLVIAAIADQDAELAAIFSRIDTNGDGYISGAEYRALISSYDANGDGVVTGAEFITAHVSRGATPGEAQYTFYIVDTNRNDKFDADEQAVAFEDFDADGDGYSSLNEFKAVMNELERQHDYNAAAKVKLEAIFAAADQDKSGSLSRAELGGFLAKADTNGDAKVSGAEFAAMWMAQTGENMVRSLALFTLLDTDGDGFFGSDAERLQNFNNFDENSDGVVSKEEFLLNFLRAGAAIRDVVG